ncbi:MAG: hypothetical protein JSC085_000388 [Candidatus Tokpelaia sp. JSC085]|nr:MAG: hypothetical protein JSC085_000388 [Candidatus Tokpelaia sp. JSC085]
MNQNNLSNEMLLTRIQLLEKQCQSLRLNIKYQRYHLLQMNSNPHSFNNEVTDLLLKLVPYKFRSVDHVKDLAYSSDSWKKIMWRHPFKVQLWMTVKRLQRRQKA